MSLELVLPILFQVKSIQIELHHQVGTLRLAGDVLHLEAQIATTIQ